MRRTSSVSPSSDFIFFESGIAFNLNLLHPQLSLKIGYSARSMSSHFAPSKTRFIILVASSAISRYGICTVEISVWEMRLSIESLKPLTRQSFGNLKPFARNQFTTVNAIKSLDAMIASKSLPGTSFLTSYNSNAAFSESCQPQGDEIKFSHSFE